MHGTTQKFSKSKGSAPSLRVLPWHLPYNWGKSMEMTHCSTLVLYSSLYITLLFIYLFKYFFLIFHFSFRSLSFVFVLFYAECKFRNLPCLLVTVRHRTISCSRQRLRHLRPPRSVGVNQLTDFHETWYEHYANSGHHTPHVSVSCDRL